MEHRLVSKPERSSYPPSSVGAFMRNHRIPIFLLVVFSSPKRIFRLHYLSICALAKPANLFVELGRYVLIWVNTLSRELFDREPKALSQVSKLFV